MWRAPRVSSAGVVAHTPCGDVSLADELVGVCLQRLSRRIVGWAQSYSLHTGALPLQALNQAIVCVEETAVLIHHSDHGSQYVSVAYNERLARHRIDASTGMVGNSCDNALAENANASYKNELNRTRRWSDVVEVEVAAFEWVSWWNETKIHQSLGYRTPVEVETEFRKQNPHGRL